MASLQQSALIELSREALNSLSDNFTITDPNISGHPIVYASSEFLKMTGYSRTEVIGQNGRMFQGPDTSRSSVLEIREAVREERSVEIVRLLNYRKDGCPFWVLFYMGPVFSVDDGRVVNFVAVTVPLRRRSRNSVVSDDQVLFGSCRMEVCFNSGLSRVCGVESDCSRGSGIEEPCEASDVERQRAITAFNKILSVLTHYSESTGRLVCGRRSLPRVGLRSPSLNLSLGRIKQSFVLTDPHLPDMPIVYASDAFLKLTGYSRNEVLGRNCRFLNGVDTDPSALHQIKESIQAETACTVRILNYRKDKSSFWNLLHISPVRNATGKIAYYVGVQIEEGCKNHDRCGLSPEMKQRSTVGSVKVAVRSSSMNASSSSS